MSEVFAFFLRQVPRLFCFYMIVWFTYLSRITFCTQIKGGLKQKFEMGMQYIQVNCKKWHFQNIEVIPISNWIKSPKHGYANAYPPYTIKSVKTFIKSAILESVLK